MVFICDKQFEDNKTYDEYFKTFPNLKLSNFQKWAFKSIVDKHLPNSRFNILLTKEKRLFILHQLKLYLIQNYRILEKNILLFHLELLPVT